MPLNILWLSNHILDIGSATNIKLFALNKLLKWYTAYIHRVVTQFHNMYGTTQKVSSMYWVKRKLSTWEHVLTIKYYKKSQISYGYVG